MSHEHNIGWLAGILDGEGCISFSRRGDLNPQIGMWIKSTDPFMIDKIGAILSTLNVKYGYSTEEHENPNWKPTIRIKVSGTKGVETVLVACLDHLTTKHEQASVMLQYIHLRKRLPGTSQDPEMREVIHAAQELTMQKLQALKGQRMDLSKVRLISDTPLKIVG